MKIYEGFNRPKAYIRKCEWAQWEQPIFYDMLSQYQVTQQGLPNQHEVIAIRIPGTWQDQRSRLPDSQVLSYVPNVTVWRQHADTLENLNDHEELTCVIRNACLHFTRYGIAGNDVSDGNLQ